MARTTDELMHDALGTSSKEEDEEEGHGEEGGGGVRRTGVSSSWPTICSLLFLSCTLISTN
jgi:hypothetical protein